MLLLDARSVVSMNREGSGNIAYVPVAPASRIASAVVSPSPRAAPVTSTTLSFMANSGIRFVVPMNAAACVLSLRFAASSRGAEGGPRPLMTGLPFGGFVNWSLSLLPRRADAVKERVCVRTVLRGRLRMQRARRGAAIVWKRWWKWVVVRENLSQEDWRGMKVRKRAK